MLFSSSVAPHYVSTFSTVDIDSLVVLAIKSSMMVGNNWAAVWKTFRANGLFWFYRGYLPAAMNQGLIMVLQMPIIEELRRLLGVGTI